MIKKLNLIIVLCMIFINISLSAEPPADTQDKEKGTINITKEDKTARIFLPLLRYYNTKDTFAEVNPLNMVAFLVGNNEYRSYTKFPTLNHCSDDVILISRILSECCKLNKKNIHMSINNTATQFKNKLSWILSHLEEKQSLLISFSGHGARDGSLVFVDGSIITPDELKSLINTFPHDTILMIDACYAGNNEGPFNQRANKVFKDNCLRIYASLAHNTAKEIEYTNGYFYPIKEFQEKVLGLKEKKSLKGNGYFTSLIGYFFAEYDFSSRKNITFQDLSTYIITKGNQYIEFLARRGNKAPSFLEEAYVRSNQQPKFYPLDKKVDFQDPNHEFLVLFNPVRPKIDLYAKISTGIFWGDMDNFNSFSLLYLFQLSYAPDFFNGFSVGIELGYTQRVRQITETIETVGLHMIPIMGTLELRQSLGNILHYHITLGAGCVAGIWKFNEYFGNEIDEVTNTIQFAVNGGLGIDFSPVKGLILGLDIRIMSVYLYDNIFFTGINIPLTIRKNFNLGGI